MEFVAGSIVANYAALPSAANAVSAAVVGSTWFFCGTPWILFLDVVTRGINVLLTHMLLLRMFFIAVPSIRCGSRLANKFNSATNKSSVS